MLPLVSQRGGFCPAFSTRLSIDKCSTIAPSFGNEGERELFSKGAKSEMNNGGQLRIILDGVAYDVLGLNEVGGKKLDDGYMYGKAPNITANDFDSNAKVVSFSIF